jgi:acetyl-CoA C-acetyltransferase
MESLRRLDLIGGHLTSGQVVCIVAAGRSPIGSYLGNYKGVSAVDLAATTLREVLAKNSISADAIEELILGNVMSAGLGQAPAKQVAMKAGLRAETICSSVNKVCASGLKAVTMAALEISQGIIECAVAGGVESSSGVPYYMPKVREGARRGHLQALDGVLHDGLWDAKYQVHMGSCGERTADKFNLTREQLDAFARGSFEKANRAWDSQKFDGEIVSVPSARGEAVRRDEFKQPKDFAVLKSAFQEGGKLTVGNSSPLSDGAAFLVLASRRKAQEMNWPVLAEIAGFADAEQDPMEFTTTPNLAVRLALSRANLELSQVDFFEINEAFAAVALANIKLLDIDPAKVNVYGGAIALGHPLGCSGARILVTLVSILQQEGGRTGVAGICNGGGGATAVVVRVP